MKSQREGAYEELLERSGAGVELHVSHSTMNTAIVYVFGPRNTFAVHHREVNEIAK